MRAYEAIAKLRITEIETFVTVKTSISSVISENVEVGFGCCLSFAPAHHSLELKALHLKPFSPKP